MRYNLLDLLIHILSKSLWGLKLYSQLGVWNNILCNRYVRWDAIDLCSAFYVLVLSIKLAVSFVP